jgi:hypothetical protein
MPSLCVGGARDGRGRTIDLVKLRLQFGDLDVPGLFLLGLFPGQVRLAGDALLFRKLGELGVQLYAAVDVGGLVVMVFSFAHWKQPLE